MSNDTTARLPGDDPGFPAGGLDPHAAFPPYVAPSTRPKFQHKVWKHLLLLALTVVTTTIVGAEHYRAFVSDLGRAPFNTGFWYAVTGGLWYSGTLLGILAAHEMGHYLACRWYNVDATLPYFLPFLLPVGGLQIGTLGAVIRIRETFPSRKVLFDIGVAGPIGGFLILVPALVLGLSLSTVTTIPGDGQIVWLGKPLLYRAVRWLIFGTLPAGSMVNLHPMVFAAWFGMLATALNLLPFGQLDGGHITYAWLGRYSTPISLVTVSTAVLMTFISASWILMTLLMIVMLALFGPRHPQVLNEYEPIDPTRRAVALFALAMLVLCLTPIPFQF